ncbi:MAG: hypothetical protein N3G18_02950, partial [Candidatus Saccharicenans sp.]|nr:hypothetical protein [Candidatus Saccharicenans sp.]
MKFPDQGHDIDKGIFCPADLSQVPVIQGHVQPAISPVLSVFLIILSSNFVFQYRQRILVSALL